MKCFEILIGNIDNYLDICINRKHEMFWNELEAMTLEEIEKINRKHEMFWNWYDLFKKDVWNIN